METKMMLFLLLTLFGCVILLGGECEDKAILNGNNFIYDTYEDQKSAYHGAASCVSLRSDEDNSLCCYMKIKFRNRAADKKFTHRGCIPMLGTNARNMKQFIKEYEQSIKDTNENIDKVDINIDCNSKFMKITGLVLLAFLL